MAEGSKERHEIRPKLWPAQITDSEAFRSLFTEGYRRAQGEQAAAVLVFADGARWIWNMGEDVVPHAVQMLDCSPAKAYLWDAPRSSTARARPSLPRGGKNAQPSCSTTKSGKFLRIARPCSTCAPRLRRFSPPLSRLRPACPLGPTGRRGTSSAQARVRVPANNSLQVASQARACAGMSPRSLRFLNFAACFLSTPGCPTGQCKDRWPPDSHSVVMHPIGPRRCWSCGVRWCVKPLPLMPPCL